MLVCMTEVESTNIAAVGHDGHDCLYLRFHNGGTYKYTGVPPHLATEMAKAESIGKFFHAFINNKYPYEKVAEAPTAPASPAWEDENVSVAIVGKLKTSTEFSAGYDLYATGATVLEPGQRCLISTGVSIAMPDNLCALVLPRSGLAAKHGVTVTNAPGLIDPDYRGEIGVILHNLGREPFRVVEGDKIAQLLFTPFLRPKFLHVKKLSETQRGEGGFGHTGNK